MTWTLYYADRTTYTGTWSDAPAWGVVGLGLADETVGGFFDSGDFYIMAPWQDVPFSVDAWGLMDYLLATGRMTPDQKLTDLTPNELEAAGVKFGRSLTNDEWRKQVVPWMQSGLAKSAAYPHERT